MAGKQYGLILPKSKGGVGAPAGRGRGAKAGVASAFGEDDSSSSGTIQYLYVIKMMWYFGTI